MNDITTSSLKTKASHHESYGKFTLMTAIIPLAGFIIGIAYMTKFKKVDIKLGEHLIACSILFGIIWWIVLSMTVFKAASDILTTPIVTTPNSQDNFQQVKNEPVVTHIGSIINLGGDSNLTITTQQIIDPATAEYPYPPATTGNRYVAVKLQLTNNGTSSIEGNANLNVRLIGTDNQNAYISYTPISGCTNFSYGSYNLSPGSSATGCVVFQLADNVSASKIQFQEFGNYSSSGAEWLVP